MKTNALFYIFLTAILVGGTSRADRLDHSISVTIDGQVYQCGVGGSALGDPDCPDKVANFCKGKGGNLWSCMDKAALICKNAGTGSGNAAVNIAALCTEKGGNLWNCLEKAEKSVAGAPAGTGECVLKLATSCANSGGNIWSCFDRAISACRTDNG